jgi:TolB-like protein
MALGFDSAGNDAEVAYVTRAFTISFSSSSDVAGSEVVADSTTSVEIWLIKGESRCSARCCKTGDAVGVELVEEGSVRREADKRVEAQCIAVKPSYELAPPRLRHKTAHLWPLDTCSEVLSDHISNLLNYRLGDLDGTRQARQDQRDGKEIILDLEARNGGDSRSVC